MKTKLIICLFFILNMVVNGQNRWIKLKGPEGGFIAGLFSKGDTILAGIGNQGAISIQPIKLKIGNNRILSVRIFVLSR